MANQEQIRVLFLGDEGVGKTSIIITIASETFPRMVNKTYHPVIISPDLYMLPINNSTVLIDSSSAKDDEQMTDLEIEKAHVIILVYDVNNLKCIKNLRSHWIPRIIKINDRIPIILAGNKVDLRSSHEKNDLESLLTPYFLEFKQVEMGIECSAKCYMNFIDLIYCAQKAVLFPISPLFDSIQKILKPEYEKALLRIFRICDKDQDGFLNDYELCEFQTYVFKAELQKKHITALKEVLIHECEDYDENQAQMGVNFEAFKTLQKILIQKMKQQTCWTILRHFGYDDKLQIKENLWNDNSVRDEELESCKNVELSRDSLTFLRELFEAFKSRHSGKLEEAGMDKIFATTEKGIPWRVKMETYYENGVTYELWIALWQKAFSLDPREAFKNLVYIGYCGQFKDATILIKDKKKDLLKPSKRKVFNCYVIGHHQWTQFLDVYINSDLEHQVHQQTERSVVNIVQDLAGTQRCLIITEIPEFEIEAFCRDESRIRKCDILVIMYENDQESRQFVEEYVPRFSQFIPKILVNVKMDNLMREGGQENATQQFAKNLEIKLWREISAQDRNIKELIDLIVATSLEPYRGISDKGLEIIKHLKGSSDIWSFSTVLAILALLGSGVAAIYLVKTGSLSFGKTTTKQ